MFEYTNYTTAVFSITNDTHTLSQTELLRNAESARVFIHCIEPLGGLAAHVLLLCRGLVAFMRRILHDTVVHWHPVLCRLFLLLPAALAELFECHAKLLRHEVVNDGVDGAVGVDAHPAEEQKPAVVVRRVDKGVDHHQRAVGYPEQGEEDDHHHQHLCYLLGKTEPQENNEHI